MGAPTQAIPFITLPNWIKAAAKCGFNIEPLFRELGIETDLIHLESATITPAMLEKIMEGCIARTRQGHFPFALGETFSFDYLPDLETFINTSGNLREASRVFAWVRELINPLLDVRLEEQGSTAHLVLVQGGADGIAINPHFCETTFTTILKFGRNLVSDPQGFQELRFRHPPPGYAAVYEPHYRLPVRFSQPRDELVFDRALLDMPLETGFPALHRQAELRAHELVRQAPSRAGLVPDIDEAYMKDPALLGKGIEAVAAHLGLHPRTLQRRLREEATSFAAVHDRVRYRAAAALLEAGENLEEISERLGFSDRRSFTRAFRRWAGSSPSGFRRRAKPKQP